MKLSVVIVNYNVKHFLEQCLYSVYRALSSINAETIWANFSCSRSTNRKLATPETKPKIATAQGKRVTSAMHCNTTILVTFIELATRGRIIGSTQSLVRSKSDQPLKKAITYRMLSPLSVV